MHCCVIVDNRCEFQQETCLAIPISLHDEHEENVEKRVARAERIDLIRHAWSRYAGVYKANLEIFDWCCEKTVANYWRHVLMERKNLIPPKVLEQVATERWVDTFRSDRERRNSIPRYVGSHLNTNTIGYSIAAMLPFDAVKPSTASALARKYQE